MALHDFTNLKATVVRYAMEGLTTHVNDRWRLFTNVHTDNVSQLSVRSMTGIAEPSAWDFDGENSSPARFDNLPVSRLDSYNKLDLAYSTYGLSVHISRYDVMDLGATGPGGVVGMASQKLGGAVAHHINNLAYSNIAGAFAGSGFPGSRALCDTLHTTTGSARSNKLTSVLDRTALMTAITTGKRFKSFSQLFTPYFDAKMTLVVSPELEGAAHEILASQFNRSNDLRDLDSTTEVSGASMAGQGSEFGMQANALSYINGGTSIDLVVSSHLSDENDWFLVSQQEKPLHMHIRSQPLFTVDQEPTDRSTRISVDYGIATGHGPAPDGIVGSSVT